MAGILSSSDLIQRLRGIRQAQRKSAQDIANATGLPHATIANLETGRRKSITVNEAAAICSALGVDLRVVLSDKPMTVATKVWTV